MKPSIMGMNTTKKAGLSYHTGNCDAAARHSTAASVTSQAWRRPRYHQCAPSHPSRQASRPSTSLLRGRGAEAGKADEAGGMGKQGAGMSAIVVDGRISA